MKRIIFFILLGIATFSMIHAVDSMYRLWQKKDIILQTKKEVEKEQQENKKLKEQLQIIGKSSFVEEEARNKLFMVKPGEKVIFIPPHALPNVSKQQPVALSRLSNWAQWWRLFVK
jgi:cell division protein FtsB